MDEVDIIKFLRSNLRKPRYLKTWLDEDCEILEPPKGLLLVTVDTSSEGADFPSDSPNYCAGYFSTSLGLSDIAACGGIPLGVLISCSISKAYEARILEIYEGIKQATIDAGTHIIGGDTNSASEFSLSVVSIGNVKKNRVLRRHKAKIGDLIGVTGELSRFNEGFFAYRRNGADSVDFQKMLVQKPPIEKGRILATAGCVTSCIDLPDGLVKALKDNLGSSYGYVINDSAVPVNMGDYKVGNLRIKYRHEMASYPAGDIELLFTAPKNKKRKLERSFQEADLKIYWIGEVISKSGIYIDIGKGNLIEPRVSGFVHQFKGKSLF